MRRMVAALKERLAFWWDSCGPLWKVLGLIYAIIGGLTLIRDNFTSTATQQQYATLALIPRLRWQIWLVVFVLIVLGAVLEGAFRAHKKRVTVSTAAPQSPPGESGTVQVDLTPSSGQRPDMLLTVRNLGEKRDFYAQCTPLALRNSPNELSRGTFDLKWEHTFDRCAPIGKRASCNLLIATVDDDQRNALATMQIWGLSGNAKKQCEWSRWNLESHETIPEYDLEISIFSDGAEGPVSQCFTLRPKSWHGPLEMVPVQALPQPKPVPLSMTADDPQVVIEINSEKLPWRAQDNFPKERPIYLHNLGRNAAFRVQVQPVSLENTEATAIFPEVTPIATQERVPIRPKLEFVPREELCGVSEFEVLLQVEWPCEIGSSEEEFIVPMQITYEDHQARKFRTDLKFGYSFAGGSRPFDFRFTRLP